MAKQNAKANAAKNKQRMMQFKQITAGINIAFVAYHFLVTGHLFSISTILTLIFFAGQEYLTLQMLEKHGRPQYGDAGHIDACVDLTNPKELGMYSYVQDLLWVCWAVQVLLMFSKWGWLVYVVVPLYGIYTAWDTLGPYAKRMMEAQKQGSMQPMVPKLPGSQPLPGQSRKDKRAAARQAEKDEKNAEKAALKAQSRATKTGRTRPM